MSDKDELKILIPVLADDSEAAKGRFQKSIAQLAKNMKGANAPKIEITVSKINGKEAINAFKKEIEAVIGANINGTAAAPKINISANKSAIDEQRRALAEIERLVIKARKFQDVNGPETKIHNFEKDLEKYRTLGLEVSKATDDLNQLRIAQESFSKAIGTGDNAKIAESYKVLEAQIQRTGNSFSKISKERAKDTSIVKEQAHLHNLILEMQSYDKLNNKFRSDSGKSFEFNDLFGKMQSAFKAGDFSSVDEYAERWRTLQGNIKSANLEGQNFLGKLGQQFQKLGVYLSASAVIMQLTRTIRDTIKTVIELDGVVTDLQIATGGTRKETQELLKTYSAMGKELGATTVDVGKAADAWLRMGYSAEQTNTLIKNSMMLSKLGQIDSAEATKNLTTAMKGYNISVQDSISIVDKFSSIDMKAAVSAGYIATAMAETATSARLAGVDINKLAGYIAAIGETSGDGAESVGTFAKTLFARMGNIKAGNLIDPESSETLSDVEATLSGLGIKLRSSKGEFRNFGEILDEVSLNWSNYGTVQQRAIAVAFSGTRQQEKFLTLMEKYGEATDYAAIATNSAGTALDKYENSYLKSAEAAQARFTAQFEQLSTTFWNSDFIVGGIDAGAGALGVLTNIIEVMGSIPALAATVGGAISAISGKGLTTLAATDNPNSLSGQKFSFGLSGLFDKITDKDVEVFARINKSMKEGFTAADSLAHEYGNLSKAGKKLGTDIEKSGGAFDSAAISAKTLSVSSKAAAFGMKALSVATNMALSFGIGIAIDLIVKGISHLVNAQQEAIDKANELSDTYKSTSEEIKSNIDTISSLNEEFRVLSRGVDDYGKNISLSTDEYSRYKEIVQQIVGISPSLISGYDSEGNAIANKNGLIEQSIALMKEEQRLRLDEHLSDDSLKSLFKGKLEDLKKYKADNQVDPANGDLLDGTQAAFADILGSYASSGRTSSGALFDALGLESMGAEWEDYLGNSEPIIGAVSDYYDKIAASFSDKRSELEKILSQDEVAELEKLVADHHKNIANYEQALNQKSVALNPTLQLVPQTLTGYQTMSDAQKSFIADYINGFRITADTTEEDFLVMSQSIKDYTQAIADSKEAQAGINKLSALPKETMAYGEWKAEANKILDTIADALGLEGDDRKDFFIKLGFKVGELDPQIQELDQKMKNVTTKQLESLTDEDIRVAYKLDNIGDLSFDELKEAISDAKKELVSIGELSVPEATLKSYDEATNKVRALQELLHSIKESESTALHAETIAKLNELLPESAGKITSVADAQNALSSAILDTQLIAETAYGAMLVYNNQWLSATINGSASLSNALAKYYGNDVSNWKKTAEAKWTVDNILIRDLSSMWAKYEKMTVGQIEAVYNRLYDQSLIGNMSDSDIQAFKELGAILELRKTTALEFSKVDFSYTPKKTSSSSKKEIEEYIAAIDELYKAEERLSKIQRDRETLQSKIDLSGNTNKKVEQLKQVAQYYKDEQAQLHEINNLRDNMVQRNIDKLRGQNFDISYDPKTNELLINNMERLNQIRADGKGIYETEKEATNALRKEYEELIQSTISLNKENQAGSATYFNLAQSIKATNKEIADFTLSAYDEFISRADNFDWWGDIDTSKVEWLEKKLEAINSLRRQGYIDEITHKQLVEETAKSIYDIKNQAIQDTIDLAMELIKQEKQNDIDHLEQEKKDRADIVNLQKEALALTKEEYGYQKTLTDKLAEIAKIQNKLNELAPDDSREAAAQKKQLAEELAKLQGDLDETQADHTYEEQVKALDKSQDAFEKSKDEEIETIKETIDSTQKLYDLAIKRIDAGWDELYRDLTWYNTNYGDGINGQDSIKSAWEEAKSAAEEYGDVVKALDGIKTENVPNSGGNGSVGDNPKNSPEVQNIISQMRARKDQWHAQMTQSEKDKMAADNETDAQKLKNLGINAVRGHDGVWYIDHVGGKKLFEEYHTGGEVGATKLKSNERLALLEDKELVVDSSKTGGLYKLLDWAAFAKDKLGGTFSGSFDKSLFSASPQNMLTSARGIPVPNTPFNPTINVNLNGPVSKDVDPKKFGRIAGESALEVLKTALGNGSSGASKSPIFNT